MSEDHDVRALDSVYALAASGNVFYAGRSSGLYSSRDDGHTWQSAYASLNLPGLLPTTAVATGSDGSVFAGFHGGILHSLDMNTWIPSLLPTPQPRVVALEVSPNFEEDGLILAGTEKNGIFGSTDKGLHWSPWNFGLLDFNVLSLVVSPSFVSDRTAYAGTESGLFRSTNGGRAWHTVPIPLEVGSVLSLAILPDSTKTSTVLMGTETHGLFISTDSGATWQSSFLPKVDEPINAIALMNNLFWILLPQQVLVSRDKGALWSTYATFNGSNGLTLLVTAAQFTVGLAEGNILRFEV